MSIIEKIAYLFIITVIVTTSLLADVNLEKVSFKSIGIDRVLLEGILSYDKDKPTAPAVIFCHPHPGGGGAMDIPSYIGLEKHLNEAGLTTLRFNFRGVGNSAGSFGDGDKGEEDLKGAVRYITEHDTLKPKKLFLFGYSYGAGIAFDFTLKDKRVDGAVLVGFPTPYISNFHNYEGINNLKAPIHIIVGSKDNVSYGMKGAVTKFVLKTYQHIKLTLLPGAEHSFYGYWKGIFDYTSSFYSDILTGEINKRKRLKSQK